jgi:hypothetical protein
MAVKMALRARHQQDQLLMAGRVENKTQKQAKVGMLCLVQVRQLVEQLQAQLVPARMADLKWRACSPSQVGMRSTATDKLGLERQLVWKGSSFPRLERQLGPASFVLFSAGLCTVLHRQYKRNSASWLLKILALLAAVVAEGFLPFHGTRQISCHLAGCWQGRTSPESVFHRLLLLTQGRTMSMPTTKPSESQMRFWVKATSIAAARASWFLASSTECPCHTLLQACMQGHHSCRSTECHRQLQVPTRLLLVGMVGPHLKDTVLPLLAIRRTILQQDMATRQVTTTHRQEGTHHHMGADRIWHGRGVLIGRVICYMCTFR